MKHLFEKARRKAVGFELFGVEHVRREKNREADAMVNEAIRELPENLV